MSESPTSTKFVKWWRRPLIGGLFSIAAVIVISGVGWGLVAVSNSYPNLDFLGIPVILSLFIIVGFMAPAEVMELGFGNGFTSIIASLIFWFLVGSLIAYVDKNTKRAIIWWILLLIALIFIRLFYFGMPM